MSRCACIVISLLISTVITSAAFAQDRLHIRQADWEFQEAKLVIEKTPSRPNGFGVFYFKLKHKTKKEGLTFVVSGHIHDPITAQTGTSNHGRPAWHYHGRTYFASDSSSAFKIEAVPNDQFPPTYKITLNAKGSPRDDDRDGRLTGTLIISPKTDCKSEQTDEVDKHLKVPRFCLKIAGVDPTVRSPTPKACHGPDCWFKQVQ